MKYTVNVPVFKSVTVSADSPEQAARIAVERVRDNYDLVLEEGNRFGELALSVDGEGSFHQVSGYIDEDEGLTEAMVTLSYTA